MTSYDEHRAAIAERLAEDSPPPGFVAVDIQDGFVGRNGPVYLSRKGMAPRFGFRVRPDHCNPMMICHGGWLASVADLFLPLAVRLDLPGGYKILTIQLSIDYLSAAPLGAWVDGHAKLLRRSKRLAFADGTLEIDGAAVLRASGIFRLVPEADGTGELRREDQL